MRKSLTRKIVLTSLLSAFATLAFMLENLFPPLILPGAKMGVSNVFILLSVYFLGGKYAVAVLIVKTTLGSLFSGNLSSIIYSLPSGLFALSIELVLIYIVKNVSIVCISVTGAILNTTLQNATFCLVSSTIEYLAYLPYLALIGVIGGITVGLIVYFAVNKLPIFNEKNNADLNP